MITYKVRPFKTDTGKRFSVVEESGGIEIAIFETGDGREANKYAGRCSAIAARRNQAQ